MTRKERGRSKLVRFAPLALVGIGILNAGCTCPVYNRQVIYKYDADGNLIGSELRIGVHQRDPWLYPVRSDLSESQQHLPDPSRKGHMDRRK